MNHGPIEFPVAGLSDGALRLRLLSDADLSAVVAACQDPEIPRWTRVPQPYAEPDAREWSTEGARQRARGEGLHLVIVDPDSDELLGSVGVEFNWEEERGELGYWVSRKARGRGLAARAVTLLGRWVMRTLPIARLEICAEPANTASRRVAEQAGFTFEGVLRSYIVNKGSRRDMAMYSLLRTEAGVEPGGRVAAS